MNASLYIIKDYRKNDDFAVRINKPKTNPISGMSKMNVNLYVINDYENDTTLRPKKTNPKQTQLGAWRNNDKLCASSADTDEKSNTSGRTLGKCLKRRFFRRNVTEFIRGLFVALYYWGHRRLERHFHPIVEECI